MRPAQGLKPISREYRIYLALWRKAYRGLLASDPAPVSIRATSHSFALSIRTGMYKAIKPFRSDPLRDEELFKAAENLVIAAFREPDADGAFPVTLIPRKTLSTLEAELEALGLTEADLRLPEELKAEQDLAELLQPNFTPSALQPRSTPFYTRED